ncbi:Transmembrane protein 156 [Fukomys damarensis]|uniref:Transmembrane protein 156 n=1 Tax=Fukomys damarensis TaxID=885580 RepID=A0A091DRF8_FUKDA|nr:Transmembrane protein 156 [Fukomys damarensis]
MCSLCLVCESKGNVDFISQKQASKVLIMRRSMGRKAKDFFSPCQHFNFSVTAGVDQLEESNTTRSLRGHPRKPATVEEEPPKENFLNETCRITEYPNNCSHVSLLLEMDIKNHKDTTASVHLRGSNSEKLRALNVRVIPGEFCGAQTEHSSGNSKAAPVHYKVNSRSELI